METLDLLLRQQNEEINSRQTDWKTDEETEISKQRGIQDQTETRRQGSRQADGRTENLRCTNADRWEG